MIKRRTLHLAVLGALTLGAAAAPTASASTTTLERQVLQSVRSAGFGDVIDGEATPNASPPWYPPIAHTPQVDVAVLDLDARNRVRDAANILMSRDYPNGVVVPIGDDLSSAEVRYRKWDLARWDGTGPAWNDPYAPGEDVVPGREGAALQFMEPYPASALKTMVAFGIMRLVDRGRIGLDDDLSYPGGSCYGGAGTKSVREWVTLMITESNNNATCALIWDLHQLGEIDPLNDYFVRVGLPSLSLRGTRASDGGQWSGGRGVFMGGLDTAKLLWLIDGAPGVLWRAPGGAAVTQDELSAPSRAFLKDVLSEQGFNEVLATTNWCGATLGSGFPDPTQPLTADGIPTATPARFIGADGTVEVDGVPYGQPVAPCNAAAEVVFSHKTGLVTNSGADVGFVHALPGRPRRNYVIAVFSNLGNRFGDAVMNSAASDPYHGDFCWTDKGLCYTKAFARLGRSIDDTLKGRPQIAYGAARATVGEPVDVKPAQAATGAGATWTVEPALPAGLRLDPADGSITGVPTAAAASTEYHVTATDGTGAGDALLQLEVAPAGAKPAPAAPGVPAPAVKGRPAVRLAAVSRSLKAVRRSGRFSVRLTAAEPLAATVTGSARVPAGAVVRGGRGQRSVGTVQRSVSLTQGARTITLTLSSSARRAIRHLRTATFTLRLSLLAPDGRRAAQAVRVTLR